MKLIPETTEEAAKILCVILVLAPIFTLFTLTTKDEAEEAAVMQIKANLTGIGVEIVPISTYNLYVTKSTDNVAKFTEIITTYDIDTVYLYQQRTFMAFIPPVDCRHPPMAYYYSPRIQVTLMIFTRWTNK